MKQHTRAAPARHDPERRRMLRESALGMAGMISLGLRASKAGAAATSAAASPGQIALPDKGILKAGQFPARARRVVLLNMFGAVSQVDTFDYKPLLLKMHGQEIPPSVKDRGGRVSAMSNAQASFPLVAPLAGFRQYGQSATWASDLVPHMGAIADELCFVKTLHTEHVNHDPAAKFIHTGFQLSGRPSAGAWLDYALGTDNPNLPSFVVMNSRGMAAQPVDSAAWGPGFLPSHHQGVQFMTGKDPVLYVSDPDGLDRSTRREQLDVIAQLAQLEFQASRDPEIPSRLNQYEMAYRMQDAIPEATDVSREPQHVLDMYGPDVNKPGTFAHNCLLARRLLERNVKFVQLIHAGWDHHTNIATLHPVDCKSTDQPSAALVMDLKQRGLLDDTLVIWGSEFGRTSFAQGALTGRFGRDHHGGCFTMWFAGGGTKAGHTFGETDDFSYNIVRDQVTVHDVHATLLYLLGIDHTELTYRYQGRDFRLTDVSGEVVKGMLA